MAELATIARPYADALFKSSQTDLHGTEVWLDQLTSVVEDELLLEFAGRPTSSREQVFGLIQGVLKTELPTGAQN
jgi:F-type H+-transporting ATPase subunit delta